MESIFMDKAEMPTDKDLREIGASFNIWNDLKNHLNEILVSPSEEWNFPGKKYGGSFRMKSKKRNIIYFLPREDYFKVAFVFGGKAYEKVLESDVQDFIKQELSQARVYAEGRGVRIDIHEKNDLSDVKTIVRIKLEN